MQSLKDLRLLGSAGRVSQTRVNARQLKAKSGAVRILRNSRFQKIAGLGEALQECEIFSYAHFGGEILRIQGEGGTI